MNLLFLLLALGPGCDGGEPVLSAVEPVRTPEQAAARRGAEELRASPAAIDAAYARAAGVFVDARYLGGRSYRAVRAEIEQQLGAVVEEREGAGGGREIVFERGTLRLQADTIQMVEVPLPEPVRRSEALALLGFPPATGDYKALSLEFRLLNNWGFRRIRLFRVERGSEDISRVQAWKFSGSE